MHKAIEPEFQRSVSRCLWLATGACLLAPLLLTPILGRDALRFIVLLPMANCALFWAVLFVQSWPWRPTGLDEYSAYIKSQHPDVWRRLHPWGDYSFGSSSTVAFIAGRYDDGSDEQLNFIKAGLKRLNYLLMWPFLLIPATWLIALPMHLALLPAQ